MPERRSPNDDAAQENAAVAGGRVGERQETGGAFGPAGILALQQSAGNHSTAALVQRKVETLGGWIGEQRILGDRHNNMMLRLAAWAIDNPVHRKCVYHYGLNKGAPLKLGTEDLQAINLQFNVLAWPEVKAAMAQTEKKLQDKYRDPEREKAGHPTPIPADAVESQAVVASGDARANGSLAGCRAHIDGQVIASASGVRFEGTVHITDRWDFDPAWLSTEDRSHRTWMGELQSNVGWAVLPGDPFLIDSVTVPFRQDPGAGLARLQL